MNTQFEFDQPGEDEGPVSTFLSKDGFYHVMISAQDPAPTKDNGDSIDGLEVTFGVCSGTHLDQFNKTLTVTMIRGNENQKDKGAFCNRRLQKLFLATCLIGQEQPGKRTSINTADLVGRQCVIEVHSVKNSERAKNPNGTHIELKFDNIYHVDDPAVKDCPKHPGALEMIPAELRRSSSASPSAPAQSQAKAKPSIADMLNGGGGSPPPQAPPSSDVSDV